MSTQRPFAGFQSPTSNTTYTPNQFFDVVLATASRGVARLVAYLIRQTLGWSDADGRPQEARVVVSYRELEEKAGIAQSKIRPALDEAIQAHFIQCVRPGQSHLRGVQGCSALYELCWDDREEYVTHPDEFRGFYAGNGNLTYIPNEFFDVLIPREPLAVIKVVGAIVRHTIGFQTRYGLRRQQVAMSFTELQRKTRIVSRRALNEALKTALGQGYVQILEAGYFDPEAGQNSRAATYGLRWREPLASVPDHPSLPLESIADALPEKNASKRIPERLQKDTGGTPPKGYRERLQKDTGNASKRIPEERLQKDTGIEITQENNLLNKQQQPAVAVTGEALTLLFRTLVDEDGFDEKTARYLVTAFPEERILRQRAWLNRRASSRNRLGMLRRSIEEDWAQPERAESAFPSDDPETLRAACFVSHFYAGLAGNPDAPVAPPSANDVRAAAPYAARLLALWPEEARVGEWGRQFGKFVQTSEQQPAKPLRSFVLALRAHGDAYYLDFRKRRRREAEQTQTAARQQHEARYLETYYAYLREREHGLRAEDTHGYAAFQQREQAQRQALETGSVFKGHLLQVQLRAYDSDCQRLERLCAFFRDKPSSGMFDFWMWDTQVNPERFETSTERKR